MTLDEIRELIKLVTETKVAELEVQRGDERVRIRLSVPTEHHSAAPVHHPVQVAQAVPPLPAPPPIPAAPVSPPATTAPPSLARQNDKPTAPSTDGTLLVKSPIVG